jgi:ferritin-like metal-binding protein YciE
MPGLNAFAQPSSSPPSESKSQTQNKTNWQLLCKLSLEQSSGNYLTLSEGNMTNESLKELYIDELRDIYNAENQLVKALPKLAKAATSEALNSAFKEHLEQTKGHVQRLEQIFESLGERPKGKKCAGMEGLVKEGSEMIDEYEDEVLDAALISAAQRVEHYEIAAYGTVAAFAELLGESEQQSLLRETLEEEKETDEKLTELSKEINLEANGGTETGEESEESVETPDRQRTAKRKTGRAA